MARQSTRSGNRKVRRRKENRIFHRLKRWWHRYKKRTIVTVVFCAVTVLGAGLFVKQEMDRQNSMQITAENSHDVGSGYREITYEGKRYRYNPLIRTILYAGIDEEDVLEESVQYGSKGRADSIAVVILDRKKEKITILPISRDTMTEVRKYSLNGNDNGLSVTHLGYAYAYGNGGKVSCNNLVEAVSLMLGGITISDYVITSQASLTYLNELVDGVTLTVPNNDLAERYPELYKGNKVTIKNEQLLPYLQYRDTSDLFSNEGRMERQKQYVTAYIEAVQKMSSGTLKDKWDALEEMEDYLQTSITKNKYLDLVSLVKELEFSEENFETLPGYDQEGEVHDEFILDQEALQKKIIELFYEEI